MLLLRFGSCLFRRFPFLMLYNLPAPALMIDQRSSWTNRRCCDILPAGKESVFLWHSVPDLPLRPNVPCYRCESEKDGTHDRCVHLPVCWLPVPASRR